VHFPPVDVIVEPEKRTHGRGRGRGDTARAPTEPAADR
jgi:hypothetical protein